MKRQSLGPVVAVATLALIALLAPGATSAALADFTASPTRGTAPLPVKFTDTSIGSTTWSWDFGDNTPPATVQNPTHSYANPGTYTVTLTFSDGVNPPQVVTKPGYITVVPPPPASGFKWAPALASGPHAVAFTDTSTGAPTAWKWSFGDGGTSTLQHPIHPYARPGSYTVRLTACNAGGCDATPFPATVVAPDRAPTPAFTITSNPAALNTDIVFDASASTDPDGDGLNYAWDFDNDGQFDDGTAAIAIWKFTAPGSHIVKLRVSDGAISAIQTQVVTVLDDKAPVAGFSFTPANPVVGAGVTFSSSSTDPDGSIVRLEWDLDGDNQFNDAQGPVAQWSYATPGSRFVSLRVTDDRGVSAIAFQTINVTGPSAAQPPPGSTPADSPPAAASSPGSPVAHAAPLSLYPIVHMRARILGATVHIDLLSVRAPVGATVQLRCRGRSCPVQRLRERVRSGKRSVRFRRIERGLRAGTVLEIFVTARGAIGKYTRFTLRAGAAPTRRDLCLPAGSMRPGRCSAP